MTQILTLAAAREHLRVGDEASSAELADLIATAEGVVSGYLGRPLIDAAKGWPTVSDLPREIVHAIKLVVTDLYENRSAPLADETVLNRLIGRYIVLSFG